MTNNELIRYAISRKISLKEACKIKHKSENKIRINEQYFDADLIVKYKIMMQSRYQSIARESAKSAQAKSRGNVDLLFSCPCGCGLVGKYCANRYYEEVTGKKRIESSFDSIYKSQFATYGALT